MSRPKKIRVHVAKTGYDLVTEAVESAIERGLNRHDKYSSTPLSPASRDLLRTEITNSFWLALADAEIELVR